MDNITNISLCHLIFKYDFWHMASSVRANVPPYWKPIVTWMKMWCVKEITRLFILRCIFWSSSHSLSSTVAKFLSYSARDEHIYQVKHIYITCFIWQCAVVSANKLNKVASLIFKIQTVYRSSHERVFMSHMSHERGFMASVTLFEKSLVLYPLL